MLPEPNPVEAGNPITLSYTVQNPASITAPLVGQLAVQNASGQTLASWPLGLTVGARATHAANQNYTAPGTPQTLTAVLSQDNASMAGNVAGDPAGNTGANTRTVLASAPFTVIDPPVVLSVTAQRKATARVLVLLSCPLGTPIPEQANCLAQRAATITAYLNSLGKLPHEGLPAQIGAAPISGQPNPQDLYTLAVGGQTPSGQSPDWLSLPTLGQPVPAIISPPTAQAKACFSPLTWCSVAPYLTLKTVSFCPWRRCTSSP